MGQIEIETYSEEEGEGGGQERKLKKSGAAFVMGKKNC